MSFQQVLAIGMLICFWAFFGYWQIKSGWQSMHGDSSSLASYRYYKEEYWRRQLSMWGVEAQDYMREEEPSIVRDVKQSWIMITAPMLFYSGIAFVVVTGLYLLLYAIGVFVLRHNSSDFSNIYPSILYVGFAVSYGIGFILGFSKVRRLFRGPITYGEARKRHLSDYRSWFFSLGMAIIVVYNLIALGFFLIQGKSFAVNAIPTWVTVLLSLCVLLIYGVSEISMARIAALPRLTLSLDTAVARRADDLMRATMIGMIQTVELGTIVFVAGAGQWNLWSYMLASHSLLLVISFWCIVALGVLELLFWLFGLTSGGRFGGRISHWPWQRHETVIHVQEQSSYR